MIHMRMFITEKSNVVAKPLLFFYLYYLSHAIVIRFAYISICLILLKHKFVQ